MKDKRIFATCIAIFWIVGSAQAAAATQLTLVKEVVGGDATTTDWVLTADGTTNNDLSGPGWVSGLVAPDTFALSESVGPPGYEAGSWECLGGGSLVGSDLSLSEGEDVTCTIVNTFVPPLVVFESDFALPYMPVGDGAGMPVCVDDGTGLLVSGCDVTITANDIDPTTVQKRVDGACSPGYLVRAINEDGSVVCEPDIDTDTTLTEGQVDAYVANNGYSTEAHTHVNQTWSAGSSTYGLRINDATYGVYGNGGQYGLYGAGGSYGVYGNGSTYGVYGNSASNFGVFGNSGYTGVWGQGTSYGVIGINASTGVYGSGSTYGIFSSGPAYVSGFLTKAGGGFRIDHPQDPETKYLVHSFVESPDMMNVYNGNVTLDASGEAWVELPEYFEALNMDYRYQLTALGRPGPNLYVASLIQDNRFLIAGGEPQMMVSWQVTGIRNDPWAQENRPDPVQNKPTKELGTFLHPEAYGQPAEKGFDNLMRPVAKAPEAMPPDGQ